MCFDTISPNTESKKEACVISKQMLGKELPYLSCRYYILEILLRAVFDTNMRTTAGTHPAILNRFHNVTLDRQRKIQHCISDSQIQKPLNSRSNFNRVESKLTERHPRDAATQCRTAYNSRSHSSR
ncbi:hypothetical protein EVAR_71656_1 [Eumeta japonica]|uniref:Uncharacterized protein n=1 Tax=Eumeta variegata TaxID=151549 RepID=A0A4C1SZE8_EUMVA|nr:hypothetical protein EVAR_71656_1 [Eumeta japonica]